RRLVERLFGEIERAPVHRQEAPAVDVGEDLERFLRRRVSRAHHRRRLVRTDRNGGEIERAEPGADLPEVRRVVARVAGEEGPTRRGPAKLIGLARSDHCGSVSTFTPSSWNRSVAWPIQVTVGAAPLARRAAPSLSTWGRSARRGRKVVAHMRVTKNVVRVQNGGRVKSGLALAKPCWRWWAGAPGTGPPTPVHPAAASSIASSGPRVRTPPRSAARP